MSTNEQSTSSLNPATDTVAQGFPFREAFMETAAERTALGQEQLVHIAFDIALAIDMVFAAVTRIERFGDEVDKLPVAPALLAKLDAYARAAAHAHARCSRAGAPGELKAIYAEAVERRAMLHSDASNLVRHKQLSVDALSAIKNGNGFSNVGYDLMTLVDLFRESETRIAGRTATQPAELNRAEQVANELLKLAARRDVQRAQPTLGEDRLRALTLMVNCYQEVRRAIQYVRFHHGDAEVLAPSIYTARASRKRRASKDTPAVDSVLQNSAVLSPGLPAAGLLAGSVAGLLAAAPVSGLLAAGTQPTTELYEPVVPIGAPGGSPFA